MSNVIKINSKDEAVKVEVIDITPTWEQIAGVIELALTSGGPTGQQIARLELRRMAQIADRFVTLDKAAKAQKYDCAEDAIRALADYERT